MQLSIECVCEDEELEEQYRERDAFSESWSNALVSAKTIIDNINLALISDSGSVNELDPTLLNNTIKLPTINLPIFYGKYDDWLEFIDTFESLIHTNNTINPI